MPKESVIEDNNQFKGDLTVKGDLKVMGTAEGNIEVKDCLKVEDGRIIGNIKAKCAIIKGKIDGDIECENYFDMEKGILNAKVKSPKIIISEFVDYGDLKKIIE